MERQLPKAILFSSLYFQQPANFSTAPHPRQRVQVARDRFVGTCALAIKAPSRYRLAFNEDSLKDDVLGSVCACSTFRPALRDQIFYFQGK